METYLHDWVTQHAPVWERHLKHLTGKPDLHFLEIGSWEGNSACWFLQNILTHETSRLTCIDHFPVIGKALIEKYAETWGLAEPLPERIDVGERFDDNVRCTGAGHKTIKMKGMSQELLRGLPLHAYDVIYVDGSHHSPDALRDIVLSWDLLKENGIMIMDDYLLEDRFAMGNPRPAIDGFLEAFGGQYDLLHKEWQVIVRKTTRAMEAVDHPAVGTAWNVPRHNDRTGIVGITMARNEGDMLESFVRHNSAIVDRMIVVLHRCTDGSATILRKLIAEGLPVEMREGDAPYNAQSETLTGLLRELGDCRWILPLDADELLCAENGDARRALLETHDDAVYTLPWKTYVPTPADDTRETDPTLRITHRRASEPRQFAKVLIPGRLAEEATIPLGSHALLDRSGQAYSNVPHPALFLAHFPVRSEMQLRTKIIDGWEAQCRNPRRTEGQIFQWEALYERCRNPVPIMSAELRMIASEYATLPGDPKPLIVRDPVGAGSRKTPVGLAT